MFLSRYFCCTWMSSVFFGIRSSFVCFVDFYLLRCFYIARHLAVNFGTKLAAFLYKSSVLYMNHILDCCCFLCYFCNLLHQIVMISVIKLC